MKQDWLIPYENPLPRRLGAGFFSALPKGPGIYTMHGEDGATLYVGKAKCLRVRLQSYKRARPGEVSRKVIRLLNSVVTIRWEESISETAALLRENQLLRELRPPFNTVNTRPDTYLFLGIRQVGGPTGTEVRFRLTMNPKRQGDLLFGAYKRGRIRGGCAALWRLIWAAQNQDERFEFPARLTAANPPLLYTIAFRPEWFPALKRFLHGTDAGFLRLLTEGLLENEKLPRFVYRLLQNDLEECLEFFELGPKRNLRLRRASGLRKRLIPQNQLDDLLVLERARLGEIGS